MTPFGPWYSVIKTIKGHRYLYDQRTRRQGKRVETECIYRGRADGAGRTRVKQNTWESRCNGIDARVQTRGARPTLTRLREIPIIDAAAEQSLIAALFEPANRAKSWQKPWIGGGYVEKPTWMPDQRLLELAFKLGVNTKVAAANRLHTSLNIRACYRSDHSLEIPEHGRFQADAHGTAAENYTITLLHELAHATGNHASCSRPIWNRHGSTAYAREEWVAETAANVLALRLGLERSSLGSSAWYIAHWGAHVGDVTEARAYAEREALRAADFLTALWTTTTNAPLNCDSGTTQLQRV